MAMQKALHDKLKELLGEEKIGDDKILKLVVDTYDVAEAKDKVQKANDELIEKRAGYEATEKELKEKITALEASGKDKDAEIEKIKEGQLTAEEKAAWIKTKETGMTPEATAKYNSLEKTLKEFGEKLSAAEQKSIEADAKAKTAILKEKETDLKNKIITALGSEKITGYNAELALLSMKSKGLFNLNEGDDGVFSESFITKDENGKTFESTLPELCKDFASKHENLVSPSGNAGTGSSHNVNKDKPIIPSPANLQEAQATAAALME